MNTCIYMFTATLHPEHLDPDSLDPGTLEPDTLDPDSLASDIRLPDTLHPEPFDLNTMKPLTRAERESSLLTAYCSESTSSS